MGALKNQLALFNFQEECPVPQKQNNSFTPSDKRYYKNGSDFLKVAEISYVVGIEHKNRLINSDKEIFIATIKSIGIYLKLIELKENSWDEFFYEKPEQYDWLHAICSRYLGLSYLKSVMHSRGLDPEKYSYIKSYTEAKDILSKDFNLDIDDIYHELI